MKAWDDGVHGDPAPRDMLDIGPATGRITKFTKSKTKQGEPMIVIECDVAQSEKQRDLKDNIPLSADWRVAQLLRATGLKKHGEDLLVVPWEKLEGRYFDCLIKHEPYFHEPGRQVMVPKIDKYLDPTPDSMASQNAAPSEDAPF